MLRWVILPPPDDDREEYFLFEKRRQFDNFALLLLLLSEKVYLSRSDGTLFVFIFHTKSSENSFLTWKPLKKLDIFDSSVYMLNMRRRADPARAQ